ncbi:uncharacterized protein L203_102614 [Cryptococcus depauperatus CBS 7841]|uniref:Uncharacterized protein n=1 Tax=Cryptococcus depauperatus CBS 7841 TaxID=1295531 RepID=A0AAJ8JS44_9TREE
MSSPNIGPSGAQEESVGKRSELELEIALLRCAGEIRPVGKYKHFQIMSLQAQLYQRSNDDSPSLPSSPKALSPLPSPKRSQRSSLSPLSDLDSPPEANTRSKDKQKAKVKVISKSTQIINSDHFRRAFDLPYFLAAPSKVRQVLYETDEEEEEEGLESNEEDGSDTDIDLSDSEVMSWQTLIYSRALASDVEQDWNSPKTSPIKASLRKRRRLSMASIVSSRRDRDSARPRKSETPKPPISGARYSRTEDAKRKRGRPRRANQDEESEEESPKKWSTDTQRRRR